MDDVHGDNVSRMKTIGAGEFKQICLRLLDEVGESGEPIVITKRGKAVAQLTAVASERPDEWLGSLRDRGEIRGDLLAPAADADEWNVLRD
jgi:antitoxin (DNA-binding transcriptional repressor) of toxin-antitoxin stability system